MYFVQMRSDNLRMETNLIDPLPVANADDKDKECVFVNLINNAIWPYTV